MKKEYIHIFFIGFLLVVIQTFLQHNSEFTSIMGEMFSSVKPFIYAVFIAVLVSPLVKVLENKVKMRRSLAIGLSLVVVFAVIIGLFFIVIPNIISSVTDLVEKFPSMLNSLSSNTVHLIDYLKEKNMLFFNPKEIETNLTNFIKTNVGNVKSLAFGVGAGVIRSLLGIASFFIGVFISLYLMYSKEYFMEFLENIFKLLTTKERALYGVNFVRRVNDVFLKYILGRIVTSAVVGLVVFIVLIIAKVPYALLSAVMVGVGNMIPYVGSIVAGTIATFLIILAAPAKVVYLFIAIAIGQTIDGFLIGPKIMEESIGMSSFWSIVAVMVCGSFFGPLGMFLGVPVFVVIKFIYIECLNRRSE
ncbi:AI-2E family transporter [uncultured Cetobacterium sp.]|uniref:AI-2E family transporter n=1 Tax=uncultured Cetobacterium sp. TaxID=527638 RepID=UPI002635B799|nr:AI-2E family transporter [uncultured Cetobacterium sp.]